jgi:hypothetical protein
MSDFTSKILPEWEKALQRHNATDALDYLKYSQEKIVFSILDLNAFYYVLNQNKKAYEKWNNKLMQEGKISHFPNDMIDYFSTSVPSHILLNKINTNYFNSMHSFFDNYAQFLFRCLFPTERIPNRLYFYNILEKIRKEPSLNTILTTIENYTVKDAFTYINDINNVNKHVGAISPEITVILNDGEQSVHIPEFDKDGKPHDETDMTKILEDAHELVIEFYKHVTDVVFNYLQ